MDYNEARSRIIDAWGALGTSWGISRTMAQIHALLKLEPIIKVLEDVQNIEDKKAMPTKVKEMNKMTKRLLKFAKQSDNLLALFIKSEENWFFGKVLKLLK